MLDEVLKKILLFEQIQVFEVFGQLTSEDFSTFAVEVHIVVEIVGVFAKGVILVVENRDVIFAGNAVVFVPHFIKVNMMAGE